MTSLLSVSRHSALAVVPSTPADTPLGRSDQAYQGWDGTGILMLLMIGPSGWEPDYFSIGQTGIDWGDQETQDLYCATFQTVVPEYCP
ncbi:MAG: hypothetical protein ACRC6I_01195 [Paracoccaceae bacterium]